MNNGLPKEMLTQRQVLAYAHIDANSTLFGIPVKSEMEIFYGVLKKGKSQR